MTAQVVHNPVDVEQRILHVSGQIAQAVTVCDGTYRAFLKADRDYDAAFAKAYMQHPGPAHEKKYAAEVATVRFREVRDDADAAHRYAERRSRALQDELRAMQSVGASMRAMFAVAGVGER